MPDTKASTRNSRRKSSNWTGRRIRTQQYCYRWAATNKCSRATSNRFALLNSLHANPEKKEEYFTSVEKIRRIHLRRKKFPLKMSDRATNKTTEEHTEAQKWSQMEKKKSIRVKILQRKMDFPKKKKMKKLLLTSEHKTTESTP